LNDQLGGRDQIWMVRILRPQKRASPLNQKGLERALTINQGGHDIAWLRLPTVFNNDYITVQNMLPDHRIAGDAQCKRPTGRTNPHRLDIHAHATLGFLLTIGGRTRRDTAQEGDVHNSALEFPERFPESQRSALAVLTRQQTLTPQRGDMARHGADVRQSEFFANLAVTGR